MGMFVAGASFFKFSISHLVTLDKSKQVQTLKLDVLNSGIWRFADLSAMWKPFEYHLKVGWKFDSRGKCTAHWWQVN